MSNSETPKSRQKAEYELLKSIYDKDVHVDDDSDWLDVSIALKPLHDSHSPAVHVKSVLRVQCNEFYPERVPTILLTENQGLSRVQIEALQEKLEQLAEKWKGEVMIFELAQQVQEFLHQHNKPGTKSFYEQMLERNALEEEARHRTEQDKRSKEWRDIKEKVSRKEADALSSDDGEFLSGTEDELDEEVSNVDDAVDGGRRVRFLSLDQGGVQRISVSSNDQECEHRSCKYIQFGTKVLRGRCMEHDEHSVVFHGIDVSNGDPNLIREYILKLKEKETSKELLSHILKQLDSIGKELVYLKRLRNENLVAYLDFKYIVERDHLVAYLVQEFVSNVSLAGYGSWDVAADVAFIRYVAIGILRALAYLHQHNIIHKNIKSSSVFLSKAGIVQLGDFCLTKRMEELQLTCRQVQAGGGRSRAGRAADVQQMGALVLGLLGVAADPLHPPTLPDAVPPDLRDFLDKCFMPEESRWTARQLLEHAFVKAVVRRGSWTRGRALSLPGNGADAGEDGEEDTEQLISQFKIPNDLKYQSRLSSEFRVIKYLGSGSFGKVLKAKNRLDGGIYAIKAIELNPRNKQLNRKMIREVKLLSKLNHENVVRYFNSWIETTNVDDSSSVTQVTSTPLQSLSEMQSLRALEPHSGLSRRNAAGGADDDEEEEEEGDDDDDDDEEDDEEEEEEDEDEDESFEVGNVGDVGDVKAEAEASESVVFAESEGGAGDAVDSAVDMASNEGGEAVKQLRFLYIQMEFCEKSTLRIAIDQGQLCEDAQRYWRLVREIVEGLAYIHQQDMIHRDLKPVNIFLDSEDHVKIGDFGLATTSVLSRSNFIVSTVNSCAVESEGSSHLHTEDSHTGGVGTSFYVAPELHKQSGKTHYNKKVDIYSLGIILFEMAHAPFSTHMERCKTLSALRLPEVVAPPAMDDLSPLPMALVRQLLSHDPGKRPTCTEILVSSLLPPPLVEDSELQDFIRHTLSNPQSKAYKYLISSCFLQKACMEEDLTYHSDAVGSDRHHALHETLRDAVTQILRRHGARCVTTPLLLPNSDLYAASDGCVRLMTHSGSVVLAPRDLRVPLAWLLARTGVSHMRRYCVDRVYRERRTHGYHPREAMECAFDIVTPSQGDLVADGEMLCVLQEVVAAIPALKARNCVVRINHALLLQAVLLSLGLEKMFDAIFQVLIQARTGKHSKARLVSSLIGIALNGQLALTLASLLEKEEPLSNITFEVYSIVKRRDDAFALAKKAVDQLKLITSHAEAMGNKIAVKVCLGAVNTSELCGAVMFELVCSAKQRRNKDACEVLASGCRYDGLIAKYRKMFDYAGTTARDAPQSAVGMSVALDKLVSVVREDWDDGGTTCVVVCSLPGQDSMVRAKADVVRNLRTASVTSYVLDNIETLEDLETYGRENHVSHLVWLKENERGSARVRTWERDRERYVEKRLALSEVVDNIVRTTRASTDPLALSPRTASVDAAANAPDFNVTLVVEEKMAAHVRRHYETQIKSKMAAYVSNFSSRPRIQVLGLFLELKLIKIIATNLDFADDATDYSVNTQHLLDKYRNKKYLTKVCDKIHSYADTENLVMILYSLSDDKFKQII